MPPIYPITISDTVDLDLLYEGIHKVQSELLQSIELLNRQRLKMELEYVQFLNSFQTDPDEDNTATEARRREIQRQKTEIRHKKLAIREIEKKLVDIHNLRVRLSDPRPTQKQVEEFQEKRRRVGMDRLIAEWQKAGDVTEAQSTTLLVTDNNNSKETIE